MRRVLKVSHLYKYPTERSFKDCSFELKKGEILGFGGLVGAQRTELMEAIFRNAPHQERYRARSSEKRLTLSDRRMRSTDSVGMITEDRRGTGIFGCLSIDDNTSIASYKNYTHMGKIEQKEVDERRKG
ncbi:MAG: hypothetical protein ACLR8P_11515 [Clostridium fessum]